MLVFIWTKILALDRSCQTELIKDSYHQYFVSHLASNASDRQRVMSAFVLSVLSDNYLLGQRAILRSGIFPIFLAGLDNDSSPLLRRWMCLCIGKLWNDFEDAKIVNKPFKRNAITAIHSNFHFTVRFLFFHLSSCLLRSLWFLLFLLVCDS